MKAFLLLLAAGFASAATLPSPEQFAGFRMGTDRKLVRWDKIVDYMNLAAASSPRVRVEETGKSTNGNPFLVVTIASPETLKDLARYKDVQRRLAYPHDLAEPEAERLIAAQKMVLLITCNIHATEIGSTQMVLELVHRLATEDSPFVKNVLDNVIFLLVPSMNPDGQIIVTDWYNKGLGTEWEHSMLPELYHKYSGHDNNRDAFMQTQVESKLINKLTYREWFPPVYLDEHQMGNNGPRIFIPPFKNPINPNVDPVIWEENGMLGFAMGRALHEKGYSGIVTDTVYTSWWQGGFMMQAWWHNMAGLLTEVASVDVASPKEQLIARPGAVAAAPVEINPEQLRNRDPRRPLAAPADTQATNTYARPWLGGKWTLRNIVDYELTATYALLEACANNRIPLIRTFYNLNRKQIELGKKEGPYAYVISKTQHDPPVAAQMMQLLVDQGAEVHQAAEAFQAGGASYPAGSYVVLMAQPFRPFVKDLLEKQVYPATKNAAGVVERPYDVTGWTLPYQMGVDAVEIAKSFDAKLTPVHKFSVPAGSFDLAVPRSGYLISHATNNSAIAVNRLLKAGIEADWTADGDIFVPVKAGAQVKQWSQELGIDARALNEEPLKRFKLHAARIGLYRPWSPSMDEGWTRWLLEQYEFPYAVVRDADLKAGKLNEHFDAILFADIPKAALLDGVKNDWTRPEHRGGVGKEGVANLKAFVQNGGTMITLGSSSLLPIEEFPLPLKNALKGLRPDQFFCPGSILRVFVDNKDPVAYGMPEESSAVFYNDVAFEPVAGLGDASVKTIARYPSNNLLMSGWIGGETYLQDKIAAAEVSLGKGRVILLGFSPQQRAQPHATFKLVFNSLQYAGALGQ